MLTGWQPAARGGGGDLLRPWGGGAGVGLRKGPVLDVLEVSLVLVRGVLRDLGHEVLGGGRGRPEASGTGGDLVGLRGMAWLEREGLTA